MKNGLKAVGMLLLGGIAGSITGMSVTGTKLGKKVQYHRTHSEKHLLIMQLFNQWLALKQEGKSLVSFFENNSYKSIAIYGMSYLGERLVDELKGSGIEIKYAIDKNAENIYADIELKDLAEDLPEVDAIVVTAVYFFDEIEGELSKLVDYPIVSLDDVLYEVQVLKA